MAAPRKKDEQDIMKAALERTAEDQVGDDTVKAKPAGKKTKKKAAPAKPQIIGPKEAMIAYVPQEGDNAHTVWMGHKFTANVPRKVTNRELIEKALKNPFFSVDGKKPPPLRKPPPPRDTSEDVKSVAIDEKLEVEVEDAIAEEPFTEDVN